MKANELRIGNWYTYADYDGIVYRTIKEIKFNEFGFLGDYDGVNFEICKPIPLTEEWLLKFGFEKHNKEYWYKDIFVGLDDNSFNLKEGIGVYLTDVLYVHSLQNIYFALTGEELTLKV